MQGPLIKIASAAAPVLAEHQISTASAATGGSSPSSIHSFWLAIAAVIGAISGLLAIKKHFSRRPTLVQVVNPSLPVSHLSTNTVPHIVTVEEARGSFTKILATLGIGTRLEILPGLVCELLEVQGHESQTRALIACGKTPEIHEWNQEGAIGKRLERGEQPGTIWLRPFVPDTLATAYAVCFVDSNRLKSKFYALSVGVVDLTKREIQLETF